MRGRGSAALVDLGHPPGGGHNPLAVIHAAHIRLVDELAATGKPGVDGGIDLGASTCRKLAGTTPKDTMNSVTYSLEARPRAALEASRKVQEEAEHEISVIEEKLSKITGSQAEFSEKREGISQRMQELRMGLLSLEKDQSSLEAEIASMESRRQGEAGRITQLEEEIQELKQKNGELQKEIAQCLTQAQKLKEQAAGVEKSIEALNQERLELENSPPVCGRRNGKSSLKESLPAGSWPVWRNGKPISKRNMMKLSAPVGRI